MASSRYDDDDDIEYDDGGLSPVSEGGEEEYGQYYGENGASDEDSYDHGEELYSDNDEPPPARRPSSARPTRPSSVAVGRAGPSTTRTTRSRPTSAPLSRQRSGGGARPPVKPKAAFADGGAKTGVRGSTGAKKGAKSFFMDQEQMYFEIQTLKKRISELEEERTMLSTRGQRMEAEVGKKERQIETLLSAKSSMDRGDPKSVHFDKLRSEAKLIASLKAKNKLLTKKVKDMEAKIEEFKNDSKHTKLAEKELEVQTYYKESIRLRELLEERSHFQDQEEHARQGEQNLLEELHRKVRTLKTENKELKRDARALVEKTAEWEEENRYLQGELQQAQRKLSILPKKARLAQDEAAAEAKELRLAHEKAQVDLEMQEIQHTEEIKDLLSAKRAAEQELKRQSDELQQLRAEKSGGGAGNSDDFWRQQVEEAREAERKAEERFRSETAALREKFGMLQRELREQQSAVREREAEIEVLRRDSRAGAEEYGMQPVSKVQVGTNGASLNEKPNGSSLRPESLKPLQVPSPAKGPRGESPGCYLSSPEAAFESLRYSDDEVEARGRPRYDFGENDAGYVVQERQVSSELPPKRAQCDSDEDSDDEHARTAAAEALAAAAAARASAAATSATGPDTPKQPDMMSPVNIASPGSPCSPNSDNDDDF